MPERADSLSLIAEIEDQAVGSLLYAQTYDLDFGGPVIYVFDLFVIERLI